MENMENVSNNSILSDHLFSSDDIEKLSLSPAPAVQQVVDKRRMVCQELLQTEINYVNVLQTVIKVGIPLTYLGGYKGIHIPPQEFPKKCIRGNPYVLSPNGPKFIFMCKGGTLTFFPPKGPTKFFGSNFGYIKIK